MSVCVPVCLSSGSWKNGGSDPDAVWHGRSDEYMGEAGTCFGDRSTGRGNCEGKYVAPHWLPIGDFYY